MTETQAKSGAAGASTDADESPVETPATTDKGGAPGSSGSSGPQASSDSAKPSGDGATTPVMKSQTPTPPVVAGASGGGGRDDKAARDSAPPRDTTAPRDTTPRDTTARDTTAAGKAKPPADGGKTTEIARGTSSVPVVSGSEATVRTSKGGRSGATGTAAVTSTGATAPVIARATVTPATGTPAAPSTTVTGTGLRQTTGATSFVSTVGVPGRTDGAPARVGEATRARGAGAPARGPRRARLHLKRIDPWSVMKFSFAVSLVLFVVAIVATSVLYLALDAMHVWESVNQAMSEVTGQAGSAGDSIRITAKGVIGTAVLLGAVNMVLFTALMTLGAFVYNVCADLVGGVELTLSEKD